MQTRRTAKRGRGQPPRVPGEPSTVHITMMMTPTEAAQIDAVRGEFKRSTWMRGVLLDAVGRRMRAARRRE